MATEAKAATRRSSEKPARRPRRRPAKDAAGTRASASATSAASAPRSRRAATARQGSPRAAKPSRPRARGRGLPDPATLDFTRFSRKVQKALYDLTVAHYWTPKRIAPPYTPEQAGLRVFFWRHRWFATYRALEDANSTYLLPADHEPLLRITYDPTEPFGLNFSEC